jgi:hypothetical protein
MPGERRHVSKCANRAGRGLALERRQLPKDLGRREFVFGVGLIGLAVDGLDSDDAPVVAAGEPGNALGVGRSAV